MMPLIRRLENSSAIGFALSAIAGLVTCWLAVAFALRIPIDFNAAYNIANAKSLGSTFSYKMNYIPISIYDPVVSANGPVQYIAGLGYALTHSIDGALVAGVLSSVIVLVLGLMLLRSWFGVLALLFFFTFPAFTGTLLEFDAYVWAAGALFIGVAVLERLKVTLSPSTLFADKRIWLVCICFGVATSSKLICSFLAIALTFAVVYHQLSPRGWRSIALNVVRSAAVTAIVGILSVAFFYMQVAFAVLHTARTFASISTITGTFLAFIQRDVGAGNTILARHIDPWAYVSGYGSHLIVILVVVAAVCLVISKPAYIVAVSLAGFFWLDVGMPEHRTSTYFLVIMVLGFREALRLATVLAGRSHASPSLFKSVLVGALALFILFANPVIGARAIPRFDDQRQYYVRGNYHYSPKLIAVLRKYPYVLTTGYWQFPEISDRWALQFYDRLALQNAHLWNRNAVLFFDTADIGSGTSRPANCGSVLYVDGPLIVCRPRKDVPLNYEQPPSIASVGLTHTISLAAGRWQLTKNIHRRSNGPKGATDYEFVGGPLPAGDEYASLLVPVQAGKIYKFSAWVDPTQITGGANAEFDLAIDSADEQSIYTRSFSPVGPPARYSTVAWQCPPGITHVELVMELIQVTVASGESLRFSGPELSFTKPLGRTN